MALAVPGENADLEGENAGLERYSSGVLHRCETGGMSGDLGGDNAKLNWCEAAVVFVAIFVPGMIVLSIFSPVGFGIEVYNAVSPSDCVFYGCCLALFSCVVLVMYYILEWDSWQSLVKWSSTLIPACCLMAGCVLVARRFPWAPLLMLMFLIPFVCGILRATIYKGRSRKSFYRCVCFCLIFSAVTMLTIWSYWMVSGDHMWNYATKLEMADDMDKLWKAYSKVEEPLLNNRERYLNYASDCSSNKDVSRFSKEAKSVIATDCKKAITVIFTCWGSPLIAFMCNIVMCVFAFAIGVRVDSVKFEKGAGLNSTQKASITKWESTIKHSLALLVGMMTGMYFAASMAGASIQLGSIMMAFFASGLCVLMIFIYVELSGDELKEVANCSKTSEYMYKAYRSDWGRALFIGAFNICLPILIILSLARKRVASCRGHDTGSNLGDKLRMQLRSWNWAGIFQKICLLGELFFTFQVGVAKATYVFLSWLNIQLATFDYAVTIVFIFVIGYIMFLLPPVPGVPVYIFCGIVVAEQGKQQLASSIGSEQKAFQVGCVIACILAWVLKLAACIGQYMIGYFAGKSLSVQSLIGVDKVFTRAIEKILKVRGLSIGKVAVLVGGPDWPTSVTCGILKLNIPQMLLGTAPVFFVSSPCVLAGAFLSQTTSGVDSMYSALANTFIGLMGLGQMSCGFLAVQNVTMVIDRDSEELAEHREEHAAVENLSREKERKAEIYVLATKWSNLGCWRKSIILAATACQLMSGFIFALGGELCFRSFSVSSDFRGPVEDGGLDSNALNIILPFGRGAMGLFAVGVLLHIVFAIACGRLASRYGAAIQDTSGA